MSNLEELKKRIKQEADSAFLIMMGIAHGREAKDEKWIKVSDVLALLSEYEEKLRKLLNEFPKSYEDQKGFKWFGWFDQRRKTIKMRFETILKVLSILNQHESLTGLQLSKIRHITHRPCYAQLRYLQSLGLAELLVDKPHKEYAITPKGKALLALFSNGDD